MILSTTSKSISIKRASAFQANVVTDVSVKSKNEIHVLTIDFNVEDKVSTPGGYYRETLEEDHKVS